MVEIQNNLEQKDLIDDFSDKDLESAKETDEMKEAEGDLDNNIDGFGKLSPDIQDKIDECEQT
jgi:hypothetical protein